MTAAENTSQKPATLMLIDGHSMAFRAFYALPAAKFATSAGQHTNAVYGFISMLCSLVHNEQPTHVAVAFDVGRKTFRTDMFPEYKAQREAAPPEFAGQVEILQEVLPHLGITCLTKDDFEADDIIATLATQANETIPHTLVVTGDRDSFQLVNDATTVLYPTKGVSEMTRFTPAKVEEKYGLTPKQYPDFAALRGDKSDNLPNVPGVGEKTATKWIVEYGTLENLLNNAGSITGRAGASLQERIEQVRLNRQLTEMIKDLDLPVTVEDLKLREADPVGVYESLRALQFGSNLRGRIEDTFTFADGGETTSAVADDADDTPELRIVEDAALAEWLSDERCRRGFAVAVAGTAAPGAGQLQAVALYSPDGQVFVVDPAELSADDDKRFSQVLTDPEVSLCFHGAKDAWHMLVSSGYRIEGLAHDTEIAAYLLEPEARKFELEAVYDRIFHQDLPTSFSSGSSTDSGEETATAPKAMQQSLFAELEGIDTEALALQAQAIWRLSEVLATRLVAIDNFGLYADLELPLTLILARMEHIGIAVDTDILESQRRRYIDLIEQEAQQARAIAGDEELNLSSPKQLQTVLFETLQLPKTKKIKTGYSTAAKELEQLLAKTNHPFLVHLMNHREYQKLKTTLDGLIKAVADDGRIHTTFKQTATATGRLSSVEPNLQNIPVRSDQGKVIRSAFVAGGVIGHDTYSTLLTADYSQIEMRVMAHLSGDEGLIEAYREGEDLHNYVGSKVFDVPVDQVTPDLRRKVKAMSYGLAYGLTAYGLAAQLGTSPGEAKVIMDSYFERFGGVSKYLRGVVDKARKDGYTATVFGRRRYLAELDSTNRIARENAERAALNSPIQGTAADIIKVAMIRVDQALNDGNFKSRVLLQVHDELVVEVARGEEDAVAALVEKMMDSAITLAVPLEVSAGMGPNWDAAAH